MVGSRMLAAMLSPRARALLPGAFVLLAACGSSTSDGGNGKPGFYVSGRFLYDKCGNQVVLRGVNEMTVATSDPNSIKNTSVLSPYIASGACQ